FVLPALTAAVCGLLGGVWRGQPAAGGGAQPTPAGLAFASIAPGVVAALLWWSVLPSIQEGLGAAALGIVTALVPVTLSAPAPLLAAAGDAGRRLWQISLALTVLAILIALPQPRFAPWSPERATFTFHQDGDAGTAHWVLNSQTPIPA